MGKRMGRVVRHIGLAFVTGSGVLTGLSCAGDSLQPPTTGSLEITTTTSGPEPDADGYAVSIDDGAETPIATNGTLQRDDVEPGNHSVRLAGMAANCTVTGENPRTISIPAGETTTVGFQLTCVATTGSLQITATTSGPSPDPDGYSITLDGTERGTLAVTGAVTIEGLTPGSHAVGLSGIAANCQVQGDNPQPVTVTAGASATVAFAVTCATPPPVSGTLRITTSTTGPDQDPDGYAFAVDGGASQPIGVSATVTLGNVAAGAHTVQLSGLAGNCSVQGTNPRSVTVSGGATGEVSFAVACTAATGSLEITTTTTGNSPDPNGYTVAVDNAAPQPIGATASLTVPGVSPGPHRVTLGGVAENCRVDGDNPRTVTVAAGATASAAFNLACHTPLIAFTSDRDGNQEIYVMRADGGGQTRLTNNRATDNAPAWSPDGTRIAFSSSRDGRSEIYVMNADGSAQTNLTNSPEWDFSPTWSPDGTKIAFVTIVDVPEEYYSYDRIMIVNADGTGAPQVVSGLGRYADLEWSRDGSRLAFTGYYLSVIDNIYAPDFIGVMNANGSDERAIEGYGTCRGGPAWSTDGRIAFLSATVDPDSDRGNRCFEDSEIHVMNPDGSGVIQLTNNSEHELDPAWSRDDRKIAFTRYHGRDSEIYIMNADGSGETRLTDRGLNSDPSWSP